MSVLLFWGYQVYSQEFTIDSTTNLITYSDEVFVSSVSQNKLFIRANRWLQNSYDQADRVGMSDQYGGKLIYKVKMNIPVDYFIGKTDGGTVYYTLQIFCRNQYFRYVFTEFYHDGKGTSDNRSGKALENVITDQNYFVMPMHWDEIRRQVDIKTRSKINNLVKYMTTETGLE